MRKARTRLNNLVNPLTVVTCKVNSHVTIEVEKAQYPVFRIGVNSSVRMYWKQPHSPLFPLRIPLSKG